MTDAAKPRNRNGLPLGFTLCNEHQESVLFSMGGEQTLELKISNISDAQLTLPGAGKNEEPSRENHLFALGFSPGTLLEPSKITLSQKSRKIWKIQVAKQLEADNKQYFYLLSQKKQLLQPLEELVVTLTGVKADPSGGSHGTMVALRYRGLSLAGSSRELKGVAAHHMGVLHHWPADLGRLDELLKDQPTTLPGLIAENQTEKQALTEIRDEILPPLNLEIVGGWNHLLCGMETELTLRLRPNRHFLLPGSDLELELTSTSKLHLYSDDPELEILGFEVLTKANEKSSDWGLLATAGNLGADMGVCPKRLQRLRAEKPTSGAPAYKDLRVKLKDAGSPRQTALRLVCDTIEMVHNGATRTKFEDFTLRVPVKVGPSQVVDDTLVLSGQLGLARGGDKKGEYPLRLYEDDGWNFTLEDDEKSGFRIGPKEPSGKAAMTYFSARKKSVEIGSFTDAHNNYLSVRTAKNNDAGIRLEHGDSKHSFILDVAGVNKANAAEAKVIAMSLDDFTRSVKYDISNNQVVKKLGLPLKPDGTATTESWNLAVQISILGRRARQRDRWLTRRGLRSSLTNRIHKIKKGIANRVIGRGLRLRQNERTDMFVDEASGKIGIGTSDPKAELHVNGRLRDKTGWVMPVGTILSYAGRKAPDGWLLCDGSDYDKAVYPELYDVIGTRHDKAASRYPRKFKVPNLIDRFIVGCAMGDKKPLGASKSQKAGAYANAAIGGSKMVTLGVNNIPAHKHTLNDPGHVHTTKLHEGGARGDREGGKWSFLVSDATTAGKKAPEKGYTSGNAFNYTWNPFATKTGTGITMENKGKGDAFYITPEYYALIYIIKF